MGITVKPRHPALGAEILGIDMRQPIDAATVQAVSDAWMKHLVLVFPDQRVSDAEHVAFTRKFGEPEIFHQTSLHLRSDRVREIFLVSNVDEQDRLMTPAEPSQKQLSSSRQWHTDSSYRPMPSVGSLLHGIEISRTGGITQFINMYMVYDDLPEGLRKQVEGRKARHDFGMLSRVVGSPPPTAEEQAAMPPVWHPMVRCHPVTGRKSLYISSIYNDAIEGMADGPARRLIEELTEFAAQPKYMYRHVWEPHDVVMWDNRCTVHAVTPHDPGERRVMHRTTIVGREPVTAG
ncbi:MAG: TauD/TfdA family dioxygenase [Alphaproteobacteria bacterium]|nr:TauD/TfdA family dioxygenase [Alphaproteobacteria bacterium]MBV8410962.1 TauD/TfdA family dioxygenase [Alphaproteobacteria bacterium]